MAKFKIGDKVVVVDARPSGLKGDYYRNGDKGIVSSIEHERHGHVTRDDGVEMNVYWDEVDFEKETEMNAEQIRDEILRIDVRIEEANKDIEKAQEERNSLVEKLREKGFELSNNSVQVVIKDKNYHSVGDTVTIIASRHGHAFDIGEKVKILSYDGYGYGEYDCTNGEESWFVRDDEIAGLS